MLTIRTDRPEAEIYLYDGDALLAKDKWQAHRELSSTLHSRLKKLLKSIGKDWHDIEGIVAYQGPGSFTGLRIGLSVANALAASLNIPIIGSKGADWQAAGLARIIKGENDELVEPYYGSPAFTTGPIK